MGMDEVCILDSHDSRGPPVGSMKHISLVIAGVAGRKGNGLMAEGVADGIAEIVGFGLIEGRSFAGLILGTLILSR